jgi:hypothetical protein
MIKKVLFAVVFVCLLSNLSLLHGQSGVLSIYPDPADFGIVDLNSSGYPLTFYLSNTTSSSVQITGMTIAGTNSGDFGFYGGNCVGTIPANQFCQMAMVLTPSAMGSRAATLKIAVSGVANPISVPLTGTGGNPIPNITSLSPASAYQGSSGTKVTITGTGFVSSSVVLWNGSTLPTTFVTASQLTVQVPASDLVNQGSNNVFVSNPAPGGGSGQSASFQIIGLDPSLNFLAPSFQVSGTPASPIVINGQNFMTGATVLWNGKPLPTTYINSNQIQAQPTASQLAKANIVQLSVSNPSPGGVSQTLPFNVTYPTKVLTIDVPANDLVWDPYARRIYASLPSSYGVHGNTIAVINPFNGAVSAYHFAGSEPTKLALSADGNYLYVGLNGTGSVRRFILPSFSPDTTVSLDTSNSVLTAAALAVSPADSHTVAVIPSNNNCCGSGQGPVEFFHDTQLLADKVTSFNFSSIAFANSTTLFGYVNSTLGEVNVTATGGKLGKTWQGLLQGSDIRYEAGLIYSNQGQVFDPSSETLVGSFDLSTNSCCAPVQIVPVAPINRVFAAGVTPFSNNTLGITSYNLSQFTPIAVANLSQINGSVSSTYLRWGGNGLAFTVQPNCCNGNVPQVILVQSPAMLLASGVGHNPVPKVTSLTPSSATHGTGNFPITIQGTGFVPSSAVTFNGRQLTVDYRSATQLVVYVPGSDILTAGPANVVVTNPLPAGGTSSSTFTIN